MSVGQSRVILWLFLLLLLPVPVVMGHTGWLPVARLLVAAQQGGQGAWWLLGYGLWWCAALGGLAWGYGRLSATFPAKIRGSLVGILGLSLLIVFCSVPVYLPVSEAGGEYRNFFQIYRLKS